MHHYNEPGGMRHGAMSYGMMGYSWVWMIGLTLLIIIVLIGLFMIIKQLRRSEQNNRQDMTQDRSLTILKERFAQGEITEKEYYDKRKVLEDE